jgi:transcriptional regulator with PAS, ATPase and Fis domain
MVQAADGERNRVLAAALELASGPALVLDDKLHIVLATKAAHALMGFEIPLGELAPKILCGEASKRPVAEALAEGKAVQALVPRPVGDEIAWLKIRAIPLGSEQERCGWLLLLEHASEELQEGPVLFHKMWTQDARMKRVFHIIERVAADDVTVLVRGETGAGKELVAQAIHACSDRKSGPFRAINCAALPSNLLESELFGHARGAFTGAVRDTQGHIQLAHHGTLFLDEVAEMPLELQAKLLRVLETRTVIPVGAREPIPVDVRVVSATHRSLRKEVEDGRFRADLMYRLRVIPIFLPPLRERVPDIELLCQMFLKEMNPKRRRNIEQISPGARQVLENYDWPGNVRELKNVLAYAYAIGDGPVLLPGDFPPEISDPGLSAQVEQAELPGVRVPDLGEEWSPEARRILEVLERTAGNRERAAQILGLSRVTLWRKMKSLGLTESKGNDSAVEGKG